MRAHAAGVEMGIGLHTGDVVVGDIGSDRRAEYGVVGLVAAASRLPDG
jgi:class 3 adenylate cyclase